jgi:acetyl-CoA carboxylase carboxyltransferase component
MATENSVPGRVEMDGLFTGKAQLGNQSIGIVYCDFRVNGGSFGHENSRRLTAFIEEMDRLGFPVFFHVNSLGVRIMQGRTVFDSAFRLWPALTRFRKKNLLVTSAAGKCLGLGAILFSLGHYRIAVGGETHINLTGPEVMKLFFGESFSFEDFSSAESQSETTDLIHEIAKDRESAFSRARTVLELASPHKRLQPPASEISPMPGPAHLRERVKGRLNQILDQVGSTRAELFPQMSSIVKIFVCEREGQKVGLFINPPGNANNMITIETLQKYGAGLDLFRALGLPVVSLLDSPGADPRLEQSKRNNIRMMCSIADKIIFYPHGTMGVVIGRAYGGATTLCFPKVFGGRRCYALEGAQLGIMHSSIIEKLFSQSPRLLEDWQQIKGSENNQLEDLIHQGILDGKIPESELGASVSGFLRELAPAAGRSVVPLRARVLERRRAAASIAFACRRMLSERRAAALRA